MRKACTTAGIVFVLITCCTGADKPKPTGADERFPADIMFRKLAVVDLQGKSLEEAINTLRTEAKANILVDWRHLEDAKLDRKTPVKYSARNVDLLSAMAGMMESLSNKLMMQPTHAAILLSTKDGVMKNPRGWVGLIELPKTTNREEMKTAVLMHKPVGELKLDKSQLDDALKFAADIGLPLEIDWPALKKAGVDPKQTVELTLRNAQASDALYWIIHSVDANESLAYAIRGGKIKVSSEAELRKPGR